MNAAATQDLRAVEVWPTIAAVLDSGPAPSARAQSAAQLLDDWRAQGASRLDRDLDGWIDHPGRRVLDAGWRRSATRCCARPRHARLRLARSTPTTTSRAPNGTASAAGWYGYVDKDLRTLLGTPCDGPLPDALLRRRAIWPPAATALWAALDATAAELRPLREPIPPAGAPTRPGSGSASRAASAPHDALRQPADVPAGHDVYGASAAVSVGCQTGVRPGRNTPGKGGWLG